MAKYNYDWLIEQYIQMFGDIDEDTLEALVLFVESNRSRTIYYDLAMLYFYKKPLWCININARRQVRQAIKSTVLEPFESLIVEKILTDAKAKALQSVDYHAYNWREYHRCERGSKTKFLSLVKNKILKIFHIKSK